MRAVGLAVGALCRRAYGREVGLGRLVGVRPVSQGFTFPLAIFLASFLLDCVGCKKIEKESAVCRRTALFLRILDGRQITEITQDTGTETR